MKETATVLKFAITPNVAPLVVPKGSQFLHVGAQGPGVLHIWAQCFVNGLDNGGFDLEGVETETWDIRVFGTGHIMPMIAMKHLGTVQDGPFVWHVFDATVR